jgi:glyoxylase-like metal-dependent hydrolase (beta-lactamase superfamily II)
MPQPVGAITLSIVLGVGRVNCYLLRAGRGYVLIDTGPPRARRALDRKLAGLGCAPGQLSLIVLTHGDFDHTGNAAYLRSTFGGRIAMHADDARAGEDGDMFAGRDTSSRALGAAIPRIIGFGASERFTPDVLLEDGGSLADYGLDAAVVRIPGHSRGSIGILTADGHFFCGDFLDNTRKPALTSLIDDREAAERSVAELKTLPIRMVFPGHGKPFPIDRLALR